MKATVRDKGTHHFFFFFGHDIKHCHCHFHKLCFVYCNTYSLFHQNLKMDSRHTSETSLKDKT